MVIGRLYMGKLFQIYNRKVGNPYREKKQDLNDDIADRL
jgi:hypothetical protein